MRNLFASSWSTKFHGVDAQSFTKLILSNIAMLL